MSQKTLVILPGWGGSKETWEEFRQLASSSIDDIWVIDLPCFGTEPCPTDVWGVAEYAEFAAKKIQEKTTTPVVLMGHSFGGAVALAIAANKLVPIDHLILVNAAVVRPKRKIKRFVFGSLAKAGYAILGNWIPAQLRRFIYNLIGGEDQHDVSLMQKAIYQKIVREDTAHLLPKVSIPTLIIWGKKDRMTPISQGRRIARSIPGSSFVLISDGAHGLHHTHGRDLLENIVNRVYSGV